MKQVDGIFVAKPTVAGVQRFRRAFNRRTGHHLEFMRRLTYLLGLSAALHLHRHRHSTVARRRHCRPCSPCLLVASSLIGSGGHALAAPRHTAGIGYAGLDHGLLFLGLFSSLFVLTVLRDVLLLLGWIVSLIAPQSLPRGLRTLTAAAAAPAGPGGDLHWLPERRANGPGEDGGDTAGRVAGGTPRLHHRADQRRHVGPTIRARYVEGDRGGRQPSQA